MFDVVELQKLIGKKVIPVSNITQEYWKAYILIKYVITKETVYAILDENFNIEVDLKDFVLIGEKG